NLNAVDVEVFKIYENNVRQFFQVNDSSRGRDRPTRFSTSARSTSIWLRSVFEIKRSSSTRISTSCNH
ncbi:MAG: hypothetical protein K2X47_11920, partial [Bdellovibrionales bacterium]|nr:hypothetical protein [Bdellovibrionales bacterium]